MNKILFHNRRIPFVSLVGAVDVYLIVIAQSVVIRILCARATVCAYCKQNEQPDEMTWHMCFMSNPSTNRFANARYDDSNDHCGVVSAHRHENRTSISPVLATRPRQGATLLSTSSRRGR